MLVRMWAIVIASILNASAQDPVLAARQWRVEHQAEILNEFTSLLSIPNVAADPANLNRNANTLMSSCKGATLQHGSFPFREHHPSSSANGNWPGQRTRSSFTRITMDSR